jgi:WASH complex subunit 7
MNNQQGQNNESNENDDRRVRALLTMDPVYICQKKIDLNFVVQNELEKSFYNFCVINLNDCNVYAEMRSLANERYGININDPYLPDGTLDQRFDLLVILRDFECESSDWLY